MIPLNPNGSPPFLERNFLEQPAASAGSPPGGSPKRPSRRPDWLLILVAALGLFVSMLFLLI